MIEVRPLLAADLPEADRVFRLAFGTQFGLSDPLTFRGDGELVRPRWRADPSAAFAAFRGGELVGSSLCARWGSFGIFGPITVRPDSWDAGIGKALLEPSMALFDKWNVREAGLFTFPDSPRHVGLYQKFGFWPQTLTAVMSKQVAPSKAELDEGQSASAAECAEITGAIHPGLDLERELRMLQEQKLGRALFLREGGTLKAFAVCHYGKGSEAGSGSTFVKFAAVRPGEDAPLWFDRLLARCEALAAETGSTKLMAGVNTARHPAYKKMLERGFRAFLHGIAMTRPNGVVYNRPDVFVVDDWR